MTIYRIEKNELYNSREIYFEGKPAEATRTALKGLKMRWNPVKGCWYGYAGENEIISAILKSNENAEPDEAGTVITDGYLGGGAIHGSKSHKALYGADLSAAIRADIKIAGIKGVTVSCKTYSGGQDITAKVTVERSDTVTDYRMSEREFLTRLDRYGIYLNDRWYHYSDVFDANGEWTDDTYRVLVEASEAQVELFGKEQGINQYHIDEYDVLTPEFRAKLHKINGIINAYRYDESNSQVDYFETNFYYDLETVPGRSWGQAKCKDTKILQIK